jgi:chloramphenicol O-acetyltransferase type B
MGEKYTLIDEISWKRAIHCAVFRNHVEPAFCVTTELDITKFREKLRARGLPFTFSMIFAVTKCANAIEEFRYRFVDGKVVLFDRIDTSFRRIIHLSTDFMSENSFLRCRNSWMRFSWNDRI